MSQHGLQPIEDAACVRCESSCRNKAIPWHVQSPAPNTGSRSQSRRTAPTPLGTSWHSQRPPPGSPEWASIRRALPNRKPARLTSARICCPDCSRQRCRRIILKGEAENPPWTKQMLIWHECWMHHVYGMCWHRIYFWNVTCWIRWLHSTIKDHTPACISQSK